MKFKDLQMGDTFETIDIATLESGLEFPVIGMNLYLIHNSKDRVVVVKELKGRIDKVVNTGNFDVSKNEISFMSFIETFSIATEMTYCFAGETRV